MDIEKLISCVYNRPTLWDKHSKNYNNRDVSKRLWAEVASEMDMAVADIKKKWSNLSQPHSQLQNRRPATSNVGTCVSTCTSELLVRVVPSAIGRQSRFWCTPSEVSTLQSSSAALVSLSSIDLAAPVHGVDKVLCVGLNYKDHCEEQNLTPPEVPMIFSKFSSTIIGPKDAVRLRTQVTDKVDWEVELTVVIGKEASNVKAGDAFNYIAGYTIAQDISARNWQKAKNGGQFLLGKSMDTFCPIGPCITTSDDIGDPQNLEIKCSINGVLKQKSRTDQLVHKIPNIIERLTSVMTLLPGDIILTGTPGGVGMYRDPPEYLKPGDVIRSEIQNIGVLETRAEWACTYCEPPECLKPAGGVIRSEIQNIGVLVTRVQAF